MTSFLCDLALKDKDSEVVVYDLNDNRCRYHPHRAKGKTQPLLKSFPCQLTFCYFYPSLFSLHCQQSFVLAQGNQIEQHLCCAAQDRGLEFSLTYRKRPKSFVNLFQIYVSRFMNIFIPFEQRDFLVDYTATRVNESCPLGIQLGDAFTFNVDNADELCPAAFHSVYPSGKLLENRCSVGCPDYRTHVKFRSSHDQPKDNIYTQCDTYRVKIQLKRISGTFDVPIKQGVWYSMDELIETLHLQCLTSFYIAFPYLLALLDKGQLGFLFYDRNKAGVCCPNDTCQVNYTVTKDKKGRYCFQCTQEHSQCPRRIKEGDVVHLENFEERVPFYSGLHDLFVVIKKWDQYESLTHHKNQQIITTFRNCRLEWDICRV
ncbi:MAG: hypothetical protein HQL14_05075 [Candidatus Omnitrophica bacterium]|nr:hypothetical protein [Candidatus Omnitrophota bacterium]